MVLMLAARNHGFASCPIGFAPNLLQEVLRTSDRYTPLMMIAVGRDASISRKRRPRLPVSQILSFDAFTEFGADKTIEAGGMQNKLSRTAAEEQDARLPQPGDGRQIGKGCSWKAAL
jgi:hypothetical protein